MSAQQQATSDFDISTEILFVLNLDDDSDLTIELIVEDAA